MKCKLLAGLLPMMLITINSQATIKATATRGNPDFFSDGAPHFIPLTDSGATAISFTTTKPNQKVVISYSAECSVRTTSTLSYLDLDILVDGVAAPPSDSDNAFCSYHGSSDPGGWLSAVTIVVARVPSAGTHTLQVVGTLRNPGVGEQWSLDDSATIVTN